MQKTTKCAEGQDNESTESFQNYSSRRLLMFMYKAGTSIKKRDFLFNIMCGKFRFNGDWSQSRRNFFLFLAEWYSFFLSSLVQISFSFFFFTKDFLPLLIFPWARASSSEFCKVHAVKKYGNYMKEEPHHKRLPSNQRKIDVYGL